MKRAALAASLVFFVIGCKPESARKADYAAEQVVDKRKSFGKKLLQPDKFGREAAELAEAEQKFLARRKARIEILQAKHSVIGSQTMLISSLAQGFALRDVSRADINVKLHAFQMQLDKTANEISVLASTGVYNWEPRDVAITESMDKLDEVRRAAWHSLAVAPLVEPPPATRVSVQPDGQSTRVQRHARRAY